MHDLRTKLTENCDTVFNAHRIFKSKNHGTENDGKILFQKIIFI